MVLLSAHYRNARKREQTRAAGLSLAQSPQCRGGRQQPERDPYVMPTCPSREQRRGLIVSDVLIRELAIRGLVYRDGDSDDSRRAGRGDTASPSIPPIDQPRRCGSNRDRCGSRSQRQHDDANPSRVLAKPRSKLRRRDAPPEGQQDDPEEQHGPREEANQRGAQVRERSIKHQTCIQPRNRRRSHHPLERGGSRPHRHDQPEQGTPDRPMHAAVREPPPRPSSRSCRSCKP